MDSSERSKLLPSVPSSPEPSSHISGDPGAMHRGDGDAYDRQSAAPPRIIHPGLSSHGPPTGDSTVLPSVSTSPGESPHRASDSERRKLLLSLVVPGGNDHQGEAVSSPSNGDMLLASATSADMLLASARSAGRPEPMSPYGLLETNSGNPALSRFVRGAEISM
jgi:hypothetical protein